MPPVELPIVAQLKKDSASHGHMSSPPPLQSSEGRGSPSQTAETSPPYRQPGGSLTSQDSSPQEGSESWDQVASHEMPSAQILMHLLDKFPTIRRDVIYGYLMSNHGDVERTSTVLATAAERAAAFSQRQVDKGNDIQRQLGLHGRVSSCSSSEDESDDNPDIDVVTPHYVPIIPFASEGHKLGQSQEILRKASAKRRHSSGAPLSNGDSSRSDSDLREERAEPRRRCERCGMFFSIVATNNTSMCSRHLNIENVIAERIRRLNYLERT